MIWLALLALLLRPRALAAAAGPPDISLNAGLKQLHVDLQPHLASLVDRAAADADIFGGATALPMGYGLFQGRSSLRSSTGADIIRLLGPRTQVEAANSSDFDPAALQRIAASLLLLRGNLEGSHEVVLGVTPSNVDEGEYAATHPGETTWREDHPLTTASDIIHAAIHRMEGGELGEGNHTGYENAKYWALGGPKMLQTPAPHPARSILAERAKRYAPHCVARGVVAGSDSGGTHSIIAGGGEARDVTVHAGEWDDVAFINLCKLRGEGRLSLEECAEVADLQRAEALHLLRDELHTAGLGRSA